MATNLVFNAIAPEILTKDNYANWSVCVESYLLSQDLWDIVEIEFKSIENEAMFNSWKIKNATALHAIQISCGPDMLSRIREIRSAKYAWEFLAKLHEPQSQGVVNEPPVSSLRDQSEKVDEPGSSSRNKGLSEIVEEPESSSRNQGLSEIVDQPSRNKALSEIVKEPESSSGIQGLFEIVDQPESSSGNKEMETNDDYVRYLPLLEVLNTGDWDATKDFLYDHHRNEVPWEAIVSSDGFTVLHHAVVKGHVKIVKELVQLMSKKGLKIQDRLNRGTALAHAVVHGFDEMVTCMVQMDNTLVSIAADDGLIPVELACLNGNKPMIRYLYTITPLQDFTPENGTHGANLLCYCITSSMFDVALELLQKCPHLALASTVDGTKLMFLLSRMPSAFRSGSKLVFWQRWIYTSMRVPVPPTPPSNETRIDIPKQYQRQTNQGSIVNQVFGELHGLLSYLLKLLGIKQIYDTKLIHVQALQLLLVTCEQMRALTPKELRMHVSGALLRAVKHGIVEVVMEITKVNHRLLYIKDTDDRSMFHCAIVSRQEKILSLAYGVNSLQTLLKSSTDRFGNNMLHLAGMLAPSTRLDSIPGAALQMQRELQWFKEVEHIAPSVCKETLDSTGQTPRELFTKEHKELVKEGQKWMKETASSCAFVGALIVTIMFTAAFTVPGGNNGTTGFPIFLDNKWFKAFRLCDAISFLFATTSILIFLGILTSRYAEEDFVKSLPTKMIIGLTTLFISIASMIIAFCATASLMLHGQMPRIFIPVLVLASVPIIVFVSLQFPLLVEIFISTYGPSIFDRKTKCWYK